MFDKESMKIFYKLLFNRFADTCDRGYNTNNVKE